MKLLNRVRNRQTGLLLVAVLAALSLAQRVSAQVLASQYVSVINAFAGNGTSGYTGDNGPAAAAELNTPNAVTYDASGDLYIADSGSNVVRRVDAVTGIITTVAGTGVAGFSGDGGLATAAVLKSPYQVAFDSVGNLYIADEGNDRIREVNVQTGIITTVIGNGTAGNITVGVAGTATDLNPPKTVQVDGAGDIFVGGSGAGTASNRIAELSVATGVMTYFAGSGANAKATGDGGPATAANIAGPYSTIVDSAGNLYVVDKTDDLIRVVYEGGTAAAVLIALEEPSFAPAVVGDIYTIAGTTTVAGNAGDGGLATSATLDAPQGVYVDPAGNLYIASAGADTVRFVNAKTGMISTIAGIGGTITAGNTGNGGAAIAAELNGPSGVAVSPDGSHIAIGDAANHVVRIVSMDNGFPSTVVTGSSVAQEIIVEATTAGTANSYQLGAGLPADFSVGTATGCPGAMSAGSLCAAPVTFTPTAPGLRNSRIVLTDSVNNSYILGLYGVGMSPAAAFAAGTISSFAGTGTAGSTGDSGAANAATLNQPTGIALGATGKLYIADTANNKVRVVNPTTGVISTFAGNGTAGDSGDGSVATNAELSSPASVALDAAGNLYIADTANSRIREISAQTGNISTVAGSGASGNTGDGGAATAAMLNTPYGIASDSNGNLYIADSGNHKIREVNVYTGLISTVAGTGTGGNSGNNGPAIAAMLNDPKGVALDASGNLYIADTGNSLVRKLAGGVITTIAGTGTAGFSGDGGAATAAALSAPTAVSVDAAGDVYIADAGNSCIRMISAATGTISTIAGSATAGLAGDGGLSTAAELQGPSGIVTDAAGNYYIADTANNRIAFVNSVQPSLGFGNINKNSTSAAQSVSLLNIGNQNLVLSGISISPSQYQQATGASTDCTATTSLAPGATCQMRVTFTPTANGSVPGTVTLTDNSLNAAAVIQTINLAGSGVTVGTSAAIAVSAGSQQTATPLGAFPIALQALVTDINGNPVSGVTVTFTAPSSGASGTFANGLAAVSVTTAANGVATASMLTADGMRGTFSVNATTPGVSTPAVFMETIAGNVAPVITLSSGSGMIQYGQNVTVTAMLTPSTVSGTMATGTVTFYDNGVSVGTGTVASGMASLIYAPNAGTRLLTASYAGDSNFSMSSTASSISEMVTPLPVNGTIASQSLPYGSKENFTGALTGVLSQDMSKVSVVFTTTAPMPDVGQYPLNGNLIGTAASNYTLTVTGTPTLTITQASTLTTLSISNMQPSLGASTTLTATVASTVNGASSPVGTVIFYSGTTNLGSTSLSAGKASISVSTLPAGAQSITAVYAGNTDNSSSTSSALIVTVITADFAFTISPSSATVQQGQLAYATLTVTGNQAFTGTVSFSCSGLPSLGSCIFTPTTISGSGTALLEIATGGAAMGELGKPFSGSGTMFAAIFLPGILLAGLRRRKLNSRTTISLQLFVLAVGLCITSFISGCSGNINAQNTAVTPPGLSSIQITAQSGTITHVVSFALNVVNAR